LPERVIIGDKRSAGELKLKVPYGVEVLAGEESLEEACRDKDADIVFMAISGTVALKPLFAAIDAGKKIALASKEPVVSAGEILRSRLDRGASIIPVDSEHSAIMQCLAGRSNEDIRTLYITGSGGPLLEADPKRFGSLTVKEVINHPKWSMGPKISVDSATLMNKGLEVIEARWLFDVEPARIKVVIHPEAIIHSLVEFVDGTISAGMFYPDMKFPILRALAHPGMLKSDFQRVDLVSLGKLSFKTPDFGKFPAVDLAYRVLEDGGTFPAVLNGANEAAVNLFLAGKIKFTEIISKIEAVLGKHSGIKKPSLIEIMDSEKWAKEEVLGACLA
jgi:1-deoxy-D-xylulose-5-phosphate reductoisomerase